MSVDELSWRAPRLPNAWQWSSDELRAWQLQQLNRQLRAILPRNRFYSHKLGGSDLQLGQLDELSKLPLTTKQELVASAEASPDGISEHQTFARGEYSRVHRTSGTTGKPLLLLDTADDWRWWSQTWQHVLEAAEVTSEDRVFLAFSFGPFIGFWSAHQACVDRGASVIPGGGLSSMARLEFMRQTDANVLCCTPSYALHLAEVAAAEKVPISELAIRRVIVAGESGGSVAAVRQRIEELWQAKVIDHSGATEIGPWGFGWTDRCGLHVIETSFIAEILPAAGCDGSDDLGELVLTSLGRYGAPVIRYRTGDIVRRAEGGTERCNFMWLPAGVVGRSDNMVTVRGVNIFPSSVDAIVREMPQITEYRILVTRAAELDQIELEIEAAEDTSQQLQKLLTSRLGLRIPVRRVAPESLPRSELKSRRWVDQRSR